MKLTGLTFFQVRAIERAVDLFGDGKVTLDAFTASTATLTGELEDVVWSVESEYLVGRGNHDRGRSQAAASVLRKLMKMGGQPRHYRPTV